MTDSNDCDELAERVALEHSAEERGAMARKPQCKICTRFTEEGSEYCAEHNLKADLADILHHTSCGTLCHVPCRSVQPRSPGDAGNVFAA